MADINWLDAITESIKANCINKTVLDLGGYTGEDAYFAIRSGAKEAVVVDDGSWKEYEKWPVVNHKPNVVYVDTNIVTFDNPAQFVILSNVIYHTRNPWLIMEVVRKLTIEKLLLCTSIIETTDDKPLWQVYAPYEGHPVSWTVAWRPNKQGLIKLLEATGFKNIKTLTIFDGHMVVEAEPSETLPKGFGTRV